MIRLLVILFMLAPLPLLSQNFIGKSKAEVKKELQKKIQKNDSLTITLTDKDSVLVYSYQDARAKPVDFIYGFDKEGKCWSEKVMAGCDSCFNKYLRAVLDQKKYEWKKINENQYVSRYADRRMLEFPPDTKNFMYTILRTDWNKEMYQLLTGN